MQFLYVECMLSFEVIENQSKKESLTGSVKKTNIYFCDRAAKIGFLKKFFRYLGYLGLVF